MTLMSAVVIQLIQQRESSDCHLFFIYMTYCGQQSWPSSGDITKI